jgi:transcriptional regulator with GAF, ATPase, and Fis domain
MTTPMADTTNVIPLARRLTLRRLRVRVETGDTAGDESSFERDVVRLGAHARNDVVLHDATVSRTHAEIVRTDEGVILRDLGSTNGTYIGDLRIREVFLPPVQRVRLGRSEVVVHCEDEVVDITPSPDDHLEGLVGTSTAMRSVFSVIARVAPTDLTVLVTGETGTGKELVSRAIHARSPRRAAPFEVFDAGSVAPSLVESELFGHDRGAFTGAVRDRPGVFERAHGGTVFLDEIGELPLPAQSALLRVLEEREVRRVGGSATRAVDVRVVAATNRDLRAEVEAGRFRRDLFYRLAVVEVTLPPLRARKEDLPLLAHHLLRHTGFVHGVQHIDADVLRAFEAWRWPGNVRELRNVVLRALPFCQGGRMTLAALPEALTVSDEPEPEPLTTPDADLAFHEARERLLDSFERHYLKTLLDRTGGNLTRAARMAGVDRKTISRMMRRHGLD